MRSYKQVKDVLKRVSVWHGVLIDYCGDEVPENSPMRPLIDYLAAHENATKTVLDQFAPQERESVLNTWLQYVPAEQVEDLLASREIGESATPQEVMATVTEFDNGLVSLYQSLANSANSPPRVQELFGNLLAMQEWQRLRNAWSIRVSDSFATGHG